MASDAGPHEGGLVGGVETEDRETVLHHKAEGFGLVALLHGVEYGLAEFVGCGLVEWVRLDQLGEGYLHEFQLLDYQEDVFSEGGSEVAFLLLLNYRWVLERFCPLIL